MDFVERLKDVVVADLLTDMITYHESFQANIANNAKLDCAKKSIESGQPSAIKRKAGRPCSEVRKKCEESLTTRSMMKAYDKPMYYLFSLFGQITDKSYIYKGRSSYVVSSSKVLRQVFFMQTEF